MLNRAYETMNGMFSNYPQLQVMPISVSGTTWQPPWLVFIPQKGQTFPTRPLLFFQPRILPIFPALISHPSHMQAQVLSLFLSLLILTLAFNSQLNILKIWWPSPTPKFNLASFKTMPQSIPYFSSKTHITTLKYVFIYFYDLALKLLFLFCFVFLTRLIVNSIKII